MCFSLRLSVCLTIHISAGFEVESKIYDEFRSVTREFRDRFRFGCIVNTDPTVFTPASSEPQSVQTFLLTFPLLLRTSPSVLDATPALKLLVANGQNEIGSDECDESDCGV